MAWTVARTPDAYTLPEIKFDAQTAPLWLSNAAVTSFTLERELVASVVPGTLRQRGGLSIGAASAKLRNTASPVATPWATSPVKRVEVTDKTFGMYAVDGAERLNLGTWALDPSSGSLAAGTVDVELIEAQYVARKKVQALPPYGADPFTENSPVDPCWIIGQMARRAGFYPTPWPSISPSLHVPCDGAFQADEKLAGWGEYTLSGEVTGWEVLPGDVAVGGASGSFFSAASLNFSMARFYWQTGSPVFLTLNVVGTVYVHDAASGWQLRIVNDYATATHTIAVCNTGDGNFTAPATFIPGQTPHWPNRVQVQMQRLWNAPTNEWILFAATARSAPSGALWSPAAVDPTDHTPAGQDVELIYCLGGVDQPDVGIVDAPPGQFAAFQMNGWQPPPTAWTASKAHLKPLGGDVGLPWAPADMDTWTVIQNVASAWLGAVIMGDGVLEMLDRNDLAGANDTGEITDIGQEWTDLPWTLDPHDRADRVEVTFTPPELRKSTPGSTTLAPEAWRAQDVITVPALQSITIPAALENRAAVGIFPTFIQPGAPDAHWSQSSNIFVFNNPEGAGSPLPIETITARATQTSATTANITVTNKTGSPVYLVDGNGEPGLILRARSVVTYETPQVITRGAIETNAINPLAIDLTPWVQREQDAVAIADYLWSRVSGAGLWKVGSVRCRLDWSHTIGKILRLVHSQTGLEAKALITKVAYDGQPGETTQVLDLVLLPWTWGDVDALTATSPALDTWAEFDAAYAGRTWTNFDADPLWTP
ncbi:MAG TPA: hypothetical protein VNS46_20770 [Nocardioides sp.]|nr:hypothetical protein [Nocardioides sp.]